MRRALLSGALLACVAIIGSAPPPVSQRGQLVPTGPRNVLLIIADDVGVDMTGQPYIAYYNSTPATHDDITVGAVGAPLTPTIARLKQSGVAFLDHWSCPTCSPTRASIITGTHPFRHGVYNPTESEQFSAGGPVTIAQSLEAAGYATALFGKWHLGEDADHGPVDHGWRLHRGYLGGEIDDYYAWTKIISNASGDSYVTYPGLESNYAPTVNVNDAVAWIDAQRGPWMATLAFNAAHTVGVPPTLKDQAPPSDCASCYAVGDPNDEDEVYRATVEYLDFKIADLLDRIDPDTLRKTTIIFLADNGTPTARSTHFGTNAKGSLHEGGINTALIIADGRAYLDGIPGIGQGRVHNPNRVSHAMVSVVDLYATIADIANADKSCAVDSVSLIPLLDGSATSVRNACYSEGSWADAGGSWTGYAVRGPLFKLIFKDYAGATPDTTELYFLDGDRWEQTDLLADGENAAETQIITQLNARRDDILAVPSCP